MINTIQSSNVRPLVSFVLFAYNQEDYIRDAVEGALSQTYEPLEIILSDDCSSDRTYCIMQELVEKYKGPHTLVLRRNEKNMGIASHVNFLVTSAKGKYFVAAAGDDISNPDRTLLTVENLEKMSELHFCDTAYIQIDSSGEQISERKVLYPNDQIITLRDLMENRLKGLIGATRTYRLSTLKFFPPLNDHCPTEDSTFVFRCLLCGDAQYILDVGVRRRLHELNLSGRESINKMNLDAISAQYIKDADYLTSQRNIPKDIKNDIEDWIDRTAYERRIRQLEANGKLIVRSEIILLFRQYSTFNLFAINAARLIKASIRNWQKNE